MSERDRKLEERENSGRFIAGRLREEQKGQSPVNSLSRSFRGRVPAGSETMQRERAMKIRYHFNTLPLLALLGAATAADGQVQPQLAQRYFEEVKKLCERDAGRLWGVSLCGPLVIFDPRTGTRAASQPEPGGSHRAFRVSRMARLLAWVAVVEHDLVHVPAE